MSVPSPAASHWRQRPERGSVAIVKFMAWLSVTAGRTASRMLLPFITLYFFATAGTARTHAREFLERALGRKPSLRAQFRLFHAFSTTVHDRVYFLRGRFDLFDVEVHGAELFDEDGALLIGSHFGSFEVLRACGRHMGHRRVAMANFEDNPRLREILGAISPDVALDLVALGRPNSMLELAARLDEGVLVGILADRTLGAEPTVPIPFLGAPAPFPTGPMRIAAALRRRAIFMVGIYRGGNRYEIRFEPLADFTGVDAMTRAQRDEAVRAAVAAYARRLEDCARDAPENWFNFHGFWSGAA